MSREQCRVILSTTPIRPISRTTRGCRRVAVLIDHVLDRAFAVEKDGQRRAEALDQGLGRTDGRVHAHRVIAKVVVCGQRGSGRRRSARTSGSALRGGWRVHTPTP